MTVLAAMTLAAGVSVNASPGGTEIPASRRLLDFTDVTYARVSYAGGGLGDCAVGVNASADGGTSWSPLLPPGPTLGLDGTILAAQWIDVRWMSGDLYVAAFTYGTTLLGLGLYSLRFVDLQLR